MNYEEAAAYIEDIPKFTKKHTLEHTREFLKRLGNPAQDRRILHVAGTNGKGSVCAYVNALLMAEGRHTGLFTSPHLVRVNERIRVDNEEICDSAFLSVFGEVMEVVRQMERDGLFHPSYFEFLLGMGMTAFARTDVEYVILETGLGGRLDATNAISHPSLTVITSLSLEHTEILGDTIEDIAKEKAGIIKTGVPVIVDAEDERALEVIRRTAGEKNAPCREISKNAYEIREITGKYIDFSRRGAYDEDVTWRISSCGVYQVKNALLALEAAEYLVSPDKPDIKKCKKALCQMKWAGRMEEAAGHIIVDGAHNPGGIKAFIESVRARCKGDTSQVVLLFSAVSDKKFEQMIEMITSRLPAKAYVVTEIEDARRVPAEELERVFLKHTGGKVICRESLKEALSAALIEAGEKGDVYCLGSLYLAGMVKKIIAGGDHAEF